MMTKEKKVDTTFFTTTRDVYKRQVPDTRFQTTGSVLRDAVNSGKKKKARKKAHQIREDLPA